MITIEQIDELRGRVEVSYEDAKEALEQSNGDILEAIIYLEKNGKIKEEAKQEEKKESGASDAICGAISWCKKVIRKGNSNYLEVRKHENTILKLSLTITSIVVVLAPYISIPLLLLALFTGHKIRFHGEDIEKTRANEAMDKMAMATNNIKEEFSK
jgi:hypothetical protein